MRSIFTHQAVAILLLCAIAGCDQPSEPADSANTELVRDKPGAAYSMLQGFSPPNSDNYGFIQVLFDGQLRMNKLYELPEVVYVAQISAEELSQIKLIASNSALRDWIVSDQGCEPSTVTDSPSRHVYVKDDLFDGAGVVCDGHGEDLVAALRGLAEEYFGDRGV